ncbi:MAG: anaerobic sulfite reductase subunit AsrA [Lentisphaeria bacterium]
MGYKISLKNFSKIIQELSNEYKIFAPKRFPNQGRYSDTDIIKYDQIFDSEEIVFDYKSDYAMKEVFSPITETLLYFTDTDYRETKIIDERPILIFARSCDIHSIKRYDDIFLKNGNFKDYYYQRLREKIKFVIIECPEKGWDTCFCASMQTGSTNDYSFGVKFTKKEIFIELKDESFKPYFNHFTDINFQINPVTENSRSVKIPAINDKSTQNAVKKLEMWNEFDKRCLMCGSCTVSCATCTCFTSYDMLYSADSNAGERRRINASCHVDSFTDMAGGHSFRKNGGERMRFKVMHKIHDHKKRFKEHHMCVGCGRCDDKCPVFISFANTVNNLAIEVDKLNGENK